jgi:hypothetical protein
MGDGADSGFDGHYGFLFINPFVLSLSKDERRVFNDRSWFDKLTTNGASIS